MVDMQRSTIADRFESQNPRELCAYHFPEWIMGLFIFVHVVKFIIISIIIIIKFSILFSFFYNSS